MSWKGKGKVVPVLQLIRRREDVLGIGGIAPQNITLGFRWRRVVNFTPQPFISRGKSPQYPLDRRLCGPWSRSVRGGEEN